MTRAVLCHPLGDPEAEGAEAAGNEIGGIGIELDGVRLKGADMLETCDKALTGAIGDMVVGSGMSDIGPEESDLIGGGNGRQIDHSTPGIGIFEGKDFAQAPEGRLCGLQGRRIGPGGDGGAADQPEFGRGRSLGLQQRRDMKQGAARQELSLLERIDGQGIGRGGIQGPQVNDTA